MILRSKKGILNLKKAIIDFDSSFKKRHSLLEKGHRKFCLFVKFQKPPKVGGLTMTERSEREIVLVDRKHVSAPKVRDKSPRVGGPFEIGHYRFRFFVQKRVY